MGRRELRLPVKDRVSVLVAALGPVMLRLAGRLAAGPADVALVGDAATGEAELRRLADAGVTEVVAVPFSTDEGAVERTLDFLAAFV